jgi:peptidoglycan/LPS O-acetylase OafA/YrhL
MFLTNPEWRMWFGIPSPIAGLVPDSTSSVAFGAAFAFGWVLHRQADLLRLWERRWKGNMALAIASTAAMLVIAGPTPIYTANSGGAITALYALLYVVAIWTWSFAIVGAALRFLSGYDAARRYVADASYWIYLAHVPIVMGLHVVLSRVPAPPEAKFLIVVFVATLVCLAMYQMFVRYTFIGVMLNGRRGGTVTQPAVAPAAAITNP